MQISLIQKIVLFICILSLSACSPKKGDSDSSSGSSGGSPTAPGGGGENGSQGQTPGDGSNGGSTNLGDGSTGGGTTPPTDGSTNPGGGSTPPTNGGTTPTDGNTSPGGGGTTPPTNGGTTPTDGTSPGGGGTVPTDPNQPADTCTAVAGTVPAPTATLNNGETATKSTDVTFHFVGEEISRMKISDNDQCVCGTWEKFAETKAWTLKKENALNNLSVQFKDYEGRTSQCVKFSMLHDSLPPTISLGLQASNTYENGKDTRLNLDVKDAGVGVQTVTCTLNQVAMSCAAGNSILTFAAQATGAYKFSVTATDSLGQSSSADIAWNVTNLYQQVAQEHEIKSNNKVDILLVDDNSASMEYEQKSMAKRMSTFLAVLNGLDWRIAITTTDPSHNVWGDGRLLEMKTLNKEYYISSATDPKKAQKALEDTIQRNEIGSSIEQGIYVTYRAIERSLIATEPAAQFFRNDANFATVVISDEDESAKNFKNIPENLLAFVKSTWANKNFGFHSIVTRTGDVQCKNTYGNTYGSTYEKMSLLTGAGMIGGAIIGSVCAADYGSQLKGIGDSVQAMQKIIELQCAPVGNANSAVIVSLNGSNYTAPYEVDGKRLVFQSNLPVGKYRLQYTCLK